MNTTGAPQVKLDAQGLVTAIAQETLEYKCQKFKATVINLF